MRGTLSPSYIDSRSNGANSDDGTLSGELNATPRQPSATA